jgi:hypothetical protein
MPEIIVKITNGEFHFNCDAFGYKVDLKEICYVCDRVHFKCKEREITILTGLICALTGEPVHTFGYCDKFELDRGLIITEAN